MGEGAGFTIKKQNKKKKQKGKKEGHEAKNWGSIHMQIKKAHIRIIEGSLTNSQYNNESTCMQTSKLIKLLQCSLMYVFIVHIQIKVTGYNRKSSPTFSKGSQLLQTGNCLPGIWNFSIEILKMVCWGGGGGGSLLKERICSLLGLLLKERICSLLKERICSLFPQGANSFL